MGRRGRRRKQLLDDLKAKTRYWKSEEEALDRTLWRTRFGTGYGPVVRQTTEGTKYNLCQTEYVVLLFTQFYVHNGMYSVISHPPMTIVIC